MLKDVHEVECFVGNECYPVCKELGAYFMQRYAVFYPDGMVEFQNPDTFRIQTTAQINDTWTYSVNENGLDIAATISQIVDTVILGEPDTIKVISVEGAGEIFLSKHHGITGIQLNEDTLTLQSVPARNLGNSLLTKAEIFDFEVGDVFFYYDYNRFLTFDDIQLETETFVIRQLSRYEVVDSELNDGLVNYNFDVSRLQVFNTIEPGVPIDLDNTGTLYSSQNIWFEMDLSQEEPFLGRPANTLTSESFENLNHTDYGYWMESNFFNSVEYEWWSYWIGLDMNDHSWLGRIYADSTNGRSFFSVGFRPIDYDSISSELTLQEVLDLRPPDFFTMDMYSGCNLFGFPAPILPGDIVSYYTSQNSASAQPYYEYSTIPADYSYFADTYAVAEGLGITGYNAQLSGLESYDQYTGVLIGYIKNGEQFGLVANPDQLQSLSANSNSEVRSIAPYPNPATNIVRYNASSLIHALAIYDLSGKVQIQEFGQDADGSVDISRLTSGVYILKLTTDQGISIGKIVKL
jgi:hypothetical protein